jgi:hypothetical protein
VDIAFKGICLHAVIVSPIYDICHSVGMKITADATIPRYLWRNFKCSHFTCASSITYARVRYRVSFVRDKIPKVFTETISFYILIKLDTKALARTVAQILLELYCM